MGDRTKERVGERKSKGKKKARAGREMRGENVEKRQRPIKEVRRQGKTARKVRKEMHMVRARDPSCCLTLSSVLKLSQGGKNC